MSKHPFSEKVDQHGDVLASDLISLLEFRHAIKTKLFLIRVEGKPSWVYKITLGDYDACDLCKCPFFCSIIASGVQ